MSEVSIPKENEKTSVFAVALDPIDLPKLLIQVDKRVTETLLDTSEPKLFLFSEFV